MITLVILTGAGLVLIAAGLLTARRKGTVISSLLFTESGFGLFAVADWHQGSYSHWSAGIQVVLMIALAVIFIRVRRRKPKS